MGKTFKKPTTADVALLQQCIGHYRPELTEAAARVGLIMVAAARDKTTTQKLGPALNHHGHAVLARVRLVTDRDRVHMPYDVLIEIDADEWESAGCQDLKQRTALLHHELRHVEVKRSSTNSILRNDEGQPRLSLCPDDFMITGFYDVAELHGEEALEVIGLRQLWNHHGQSLFPFMAEPKRTAETAKTAEAAKRPASKGKDAKKRGRKTAAA